MLGYLDENYAWLMLLHTGVPDLIPDLDAFRASLTRHSSPTTSYSPAITHRSMRYLQCPLQENCLSSSAQFAGVYDQRYNIYGFIKKNR